ISPPHDVNGENAALMSREQIIDEVADDRIRFVAEFGDDATDECATPRVPFEIDRAVNVAGAVDLRPTVRASRLFRPNFFEAEFFLELRIAHDLSPQRTAAGGDDLDDGLHR